MSRLPEFVRTGALGPIRVGATRDEVQDALERPDQFRLLINPPRERNAFDRVARLVEEQNTKLAEALAEGIADGSINSHLDPAVAATALWAAMNGILALNWRPDRQPRDDRTADELIATWIAITTEGLFARGA